MSDRELVASMATTILATRGGEVREAVKDARSLLAEIDRTEPEKEK